MLSKLAVKQRYPADNDAEWYVIPMILGMQIVIGFLLWRFGMYLPSSQ